MTTNDDDRVAPADFDSSYVPFPSFAEWRALRVDPNSWDAGLSALQERAMLSADQFRPALEVARRAAAVDSGAIEGLYDVDSGFTISVATQVGVWQTSMPGR